MTGSAPSTANGSRSDPLAEAAELARQLGLPHLRRLLPDVIPLARAQQLDPAEVVRVLLAEEAAGRNAMDLAVRRENAGLPDGKTFRDWDEAAASITRRAQDSLRMLDWVARKENLFVCGPAGTGKSHFIAALGQSAVEAGMTAVWFTIEDLGALVRRHRTANSLTRAMDRLIRTDLIVIDDIGLVPISPDAAEGFYRLVTAAYERRSLAIGSNLHPSALHQVMPRSLAAAAADRLLHHAHIVVTQGDSFRLAQAAAGQGVLPLS